MIVALPAVLLSKNNVRPNVVGPKVPPVVVIVAFPAELLSIKVTKELLLAMLASPAVADAKKLRRAPDATAMFDAAAVLDPPKEKSGVPLAAIRALAAVAESKKVKDPSTSTVMTAFSADDALLNDRRPARPASRMEALPALLLSLNAMLPPVVVLSEAVPAELESKKFISPAAATSEALPAVLALRKFRTPPNPPTLKLCTFAELLTKPAPVNVTLLLGILNKLNKYAGAFALNVNPFSVVLEAENDTDVIVEGPKNAVPVGTLAGLQFTAVLKSFVAGLALQVASWA